MLPKIKSGNAEPRSRSASPTQGNERSNCKQQTMAPIPVICNRCKKMWFTHNFIGGTGNARITMIDNTVGPCPYCGGTGRIPDGVYELTGGVVRYLASGAVSVADLRRLQDVLRDAQQRNATPSEIAEDIERKVPAAGGIAATFSSTM